MQLYSGDLFIGVIDLHVGVVSGVVPVDVSPVEVVSGSVVLTVVAVEVVSV